MVKQVLKDWNGNKKVLGNTDIVTAGRNYYLPRDWGEERIGWGYQTLEFREGILQSWAFSEKGTLSS